MKKIISCSLCIIFSMLITQCSFVDIDTPGIINRQQMFQNKQGFVDAMAGVYASMASPSLYGKELSFSFIDEIAQLYDNDYEPNETFLTRTYKLQYTHVAVRSRINAIWNNAYTCIASLNALLIEAEKTKVKNIEGLRAEAYALRAMLHLDLLRLFAPSINTPNALGIPYVKTFSSEAQPQLSVADDYHSVEKDLLLADSIYHTISAQTEKNEAEPERNPSFLYISHTAVKALLARTYLELHQYDKAIVWAQQVINEPYALQKEEQILDLFRGYNAKTECIFALHAPKMYLDIRNTCFPPRPSESFNKVRDNYKKIYRSASFTAINNDYRFQSYFSLTNWGKPVVVLTKLYDKDYDENQQPMQGRYPAINIIRLPEMYYILAEAYYPTNKQASVNALNKVIVARGLTPLSVEDISNDNTFKNLLVNEITKEYWGEGQIFFAYKRLQLPLKGLQGEVYPPTNETFVLPLPETEKVTTHS